VLTVADGRLGVTSRQDASGPVFLSANEDQALAYCAEGRELWAYRDGALRSLGSLDLPGRVLAMSGTAERQVWLVRSEDGVSRVETEQGAVVARQPLGWLEEPVLLLEEGIAFADGDRLVIRTGGQERIVPLAARRLRLLQPGWLQAESEGRRYAIRLRDAALYELPGAGLAKEEAQ
jgi:hypothetical protein